MLAYHSDLFELPLALTMAGGYGRDIDQTVALHLRTLALAWVGWRSRVAPVTTAGAR